MSFHKVWREFHTAGGGKMTFCYAFVCRTGNTLHQINKLLNIFEYNLLPLGNGENDSVRITGDFFLPNPSDSATDFFVMHRADFNFEVKTDVLDKISICTRFSREL